MQLTEKQLLGVIDERIKELDVGADNLKQFQELQIAVQDLQDLLKGQRIDEASEKMIEGLPAKYYNKAKHLIRIDDRKGLGMRAGAFVRALTQAKFDHEAAIHIAKDWDDDDLVGHIEESRDALHRKGDYAKGGTKALQAEVFGAAGALVPEVLSNEIIELLRSESVFMESAPIGVELANGNMTITRQSGAATASYQGESTQFTTSQQTVDQIKLNAKKLISGTAISNDLIRSASASADMFVRDDLVLVMGLRRDIALIRDDGTQDTPKGVRFATATGNVFARAQSSPPSTVAEITFDLFDAMERVEGADVKLRRPVWWMTTRTKNGLMRLLSTGDEFPIFREEMGRGTLLGIPFKTTNQIPKTLGGPGDEAEVYLVEMTQIVVGQQGGLMIDAFREASYFDGSTLVSAAARDETLIRVIDLHDMRMRHEEGAAIITAIDWGV